MFVPLVLLARALPLIPLAMRRKEGGGVNKDRKFFVAVLLVGGTTLFARALTQGVESALVATAIEWSRRRSKFFRLWQEIGSERSSA